jgi:chaperonin GroEL (HSP60 family)
MVALRAKHESADKPYDGVEVFSGKIKDMLELNVVEPLRVKQQVIKSATEAASMILKIDDLIAAKGGGRGPPMPGGMPPGMGGAGGMPPY